MLPGTLVKPKTGLDPRGSTSISGSFLLQGVRNHNGNLILEHFKVVDENGKPTKLTERQWVQVRTPSFKKWFGDWENIELQNWLENSSVATATGKEYADLPKAELEDAIVLYFANKGVRSVENENVGKVNITRSGIHDSIAKGVGRMKIAAFNYLPEIISNGRVVAQETNWKERGYNTVTLAAPIEIGNKKHVALVNIRQYPNHDNNFYLHEVGLLDEIKREAERLYDTGLSQNGDKEARPLGSMRKIAQSLFAVNPSTVSKVVDENGEPLVVYRGSEYDPLAQEPGDGVIKPEAFTRACLRINFDGAAVDELHSPNTCKTSFRQDLQDYQDYESSENTCTPRKSCKSC